MTAATGRRRSAYSYTVPAAAPATVTPLPVAPSRKRTMPAPVAAAWRGLAGCVRVVVADVAGSWVFRASPPPLVDVYRSRRDIPIDRVVGYVPCKRPPGSTQCPESGTMRRLGIDDVCARCPGYYLARCHRPLTIARAVWNYAVAMPSTVVLYVTAWLLQHPARAALALILGVVLYAAVLSAR